MKKVLTNFIIGFFVLSILTLILSFFLTIYFDNKGIASANLGKGWYMVYQYTKAKDGSFNLVQGRGVIIIGLLGGVVSIILNRITGRFKQYV